MKKKLLSLSIALCCVLTSNIIPQISAVTTDEIVQQSEEQKVFIVELENAPMAERVKKDNSQENPFNSDNTEAMKQELMNRLKVLFRRTFRKCHSREERILLSL